MRYELKIHERYSDYVDMMQWIKSVNDSRLIVIDEFIEYNVWAEVIMASGPSETMLLMKYGHILCALE